MALQAPTLRQLSGWRSLLRQSCTITRPLSTASPSTTFPSRTTAPPPSSSSRLTSSPISSSLLSPTTPKNAIKTYPPPPSTAAAHKDPISLLTASQLSLLDPTGARTQLFSRTNPEAAKVGDILLVRQKNGDPFAGVCLNIRRRGVDSGILLRNELTRIGVEMWFKVYSPNVEGIEVVQRREKRARRARLYYMRQPKHSVGSVQNLVLQYQRQKAMLRSGDTRAAGSGSQGPGNTSQSKKGKKNKKR